MKKALARLIHETKYDGPVKLFTRAGNEVERHLALALLQGREAARFADAPGIVVGDDLSDAAAGYARDAATHAIAALSIESCDRCLDSLDEIECEGNLCPGCADREAREIEEARDAEPADFDEWRMNQEARS